MLDGFCRVRPIDLHARSLNEVCERREHQSVENANVTHKRKRPGKEGSKARGSVDIGRWKERRGG